MSRFKLINSSQQKEFNDLEEVKRFKDTLPKNSVVDVQDMQARPGDTLIYQYVAGMEGCIQRGYPQTAPL
jgi:hypothetical protein